MPSPQPPLTLAPTPNGTGPVVSLGEQTFTVYPQRFGRIKKNLGHEFASITDLAFESLADFIGQGMERAHRVLQVFIPDLMPLHEFCGYATVEAYEDPEAEEDDDVGPTFPEVVAAFDTVMKVNRFDLFKQLGNVVSPELIRAYLNQQVAESLSRTQTSESSSATSGLATPSMTSGTTDPT